MTFLAHAARLCAAVAFVVTAAHAAESDGTPPSTSATSVISQSACPQHYAGGIAPSLMTSRLNLLELCNDTFVDLYDPALATPVYAAEHITPQSLAAGVNLDRANSFHADARLPESEQISPKIYVGSRFDKGHMAPDHDMPTAEAKRQSDSLANIVPQSPENNRGEWAQIEKTARRLTVLATDGYIVTGPIYDGAPKRLARKVAIPTRLFKAFYRPAGGVEKDNLIGVWVVDNAPDSSVQVWSLDKLKSVTGIDAFPGLSAEMHAAVSLPMPSAGR